MYYVLCYLICAHSDFSVHLEFSYSRILWKKQSLLILTVCFHRIRILFSTCRYSQVCLIECLINLKQLHMQNSKVQWLFCNDLLNYLYLSETEIRIQSLELDRNLNSNNLAINKHWHLRRASGSFRNTYLSRNAPDFRGHQLTNETLVRRKMRIKD